MTPMSNLTAFSAPPRATAISPRGWLRLITPAVALAATGVLMLYWIGSRHSHMAGLARSGVLTAATVTDKRVSGGKSTTYYLDFSYRTSSGDSYDGSEDVDYSSYSDAAVGATKVEVTYLPTDPAQYEAGAVDSKRVKSDLRSTGLTAALVCGLILLWLCLAIAATKRDLAFGSICEPSTGRIVSLEISKRKSTYYYATYSFEIDGRTVTRRVSVDRGFYSSHSDGDELSVLYDPLNPDSNRLPRELATVCAQEAVNINPNWYSG